MNKQKMLRSIKLILILGVVFLALGFSIFGLNENKVNTLSMNQPQVVQTTSEEDNGNSSGEILEETPIENDNNSVENEDVITGDESSSGEELTGNETLDDNGNLSGDENSSTGDDLSEEENNSTDGDVIEGNPNGDDSSKNEDSTDGDSTGPESSEYASYALYIYYDDGVYDHSGPSNDYYEAGTEINIYGADCYSGYRFSYFSFSCNVVFWPYANSDNSYYGSSSPFDDTVFEMPSSNLYITIVTEAENYSYYLEITMGTGVTNFYGAEKTGWYNAGSEINLYGVSCASGYRFGGFQFNMSVDYWYYYDSGNRYYGWLSNFDDTVFVMPASDLYITIFAEEDSYYLTIGAGTGVINNSWSGVSSGYYNAGEELNIWSVDFSAGYEFDYFYFSRSVTYWKYGSSTKYSGNSSTYDDTMFVMPSNNLTITCYAKAKTIGITLNNQSATSSGTNSVYFKYNTNKYYSNSGCTTQITAITKPTKTGFKFGGYWTETGGKGTQYINDSGAFLNNLYKAYTSNDQLYAYWIPDTKTITANAYYKDSSTGATPKAGQTGGTVKVGNDTADDSSSLAWTIGQNVSLVASKKTSYVFKGWFEKSDFSGTAKSTNETYTFNVSADVTYYALFVKQYTVTVQKASGDSGINTVVGSGSYEYLTNISSGTVKATLNTGYKFSKWTISNASNLTNFSTSTQTQSSAMQVKGDVTLTAYSTPINYKIKAVAVFNNDGNQGLNVNGTSINGGSVKVGAGSFSASSEGSVAFGSSLALTAQPASNYYFAGWYTSINASTYNPNTNKPATGFDKTTATSAIISTSNVSSSTAENAVVLTYYAVFLKYYNVEVQSGTGVVSVSPSTTQAYWGQSVKFTVTLDPAYEWSTTNGAIWSVLSGTVPADFASNKTTQNATFTIKNANIFQVDATIKSYTLSAYAYSTTDGTYSKNTTGGYINIGNSGNVAEYTEKVNYNATRTLIATPQDGYTFLGWYGAYANNVFSNEITTNYNLTTSTYASDPTGRAVSYYARFVKTYTLTLQGDAGVTGVLAESQNAGGAVISALNGSGVFYFGEKIDLSASIYADGYTFTAWTVTGQTPADLVVSQNAKQTITMPAGNATLTATTTPRPFVLTINEVYESADETNYYEINASASNAKDGEIAYNTSLDSLVTIPEGFTFDGFYTTFNATAPAGSQLGTKYTGATMPERDLTLYAVFTRITYEVKSGAMYTNVSDNATYIIGSEGGEVSTVSEAKFGTTHSIIVKPNAGFEVVGIYTTDQPNNINASTLYKAITTSPEEQHVIEFTMSASDAKYYAVFKRAVQEILLSAGEGTGLEISSPLNGVSRYYGASVSVIASVEAGYENLSVKITKSGDANTVVVYTQEAVASGIKVTFTLPAYDVVVTATSSPIAYDITYNAQGGTFAGIATSASGAEAYGAVNYNRDNYGHYISANKTGLVAQVPVVSKVGYRLTGWNIKADGSGKEYITYNASGEVSAREVWDLKSGATLYAQWEIVSPILEETTLISSFIYDGASHNVITIQVKNFIAGATYTYEWKNAKGEIVKTETKAEQTSTISLRSVSESGAYTCVVSVVDVDGQTATAGTPSAVEISILKRELTIGLGTYSVVGALVLTYGNGEFTVSNIASGQSIKSAVLTFPENSASLTAEVYSETSNKNKIEQSIVIQITSSGLVSQDGVDIVSNYDIKFNGQITVENRKNYVLTSVGTYERTVSASFEDMFGASILAGAEFDLTFLGTNGFKSIMVYDNGVTSNYITQTDLPSELEIKYSLIPAGYEVYAVKINGEAVNFSAQDGNVVIGLTASQVSSTGEYSALEIGVYFTTQTLVTMEYNLTAGEREGGYAQTHQDKVIQTKGVAFSGVTEPKRNGYNFAGWYYDADFQSEVRGLWAKTGNATIYAKWELASLTAMDLSIIVKDGEVIEKDYASQELSFSKTYDGKEYTLALAVAEDKYNPVAITYAGKWFKQSSNIWDELQAGDSITEIKNVVDSGVYTYSLSLQEKADVSGNNIKSVEAGASNLSVELRIIAKDIAVSLGVIEKTYDATTALPQDTYAYTTGIGSETLKITGHFNTPDVELASGVVANKSIVIDAVVAGNASTDERNYNVTNLGNITGKIKPYTYEINKGLTELSKVYDGEVLIKSFTDTISHTKGASTIQHKITYQLITSGYNVGAYTPAGANKLSIKDGEFAVVTIGGVSVLSTNYTISLKDTITANITKKEISVRLENKEVVFDGLSHTILAETYISNAWVECASGVLPAGVTGITYTSASGQTEFTDAGVYVIKAEVTCDNNHKLSQALEAVLTITPAEVAFTFEFDDEVLVDGFTMAYAGNIALDRFVITATNHSGTSILPAVEKVFTRNGVLESGVGLVGVYELQASYNKNNYVLAFNAVDKVGFKIVEKEYFASDLEFEDGELVYTSQDQSEVFVSENFQYLAKETGITCEGLGISAIAIEGGILDSAINVGEYNITITLYSLDTTKWKVNSQDNTLTAKLTITPFEITNANSVITAEKTYDGNKALPSSAVIEVDLGNGVKETLKITGEYASANVNYEAGEIKLVNIVNFDISSNGKYLASNFAIAGEFVSQGKISQKAVEVKLYSEYFSASNNKFIQIAYNEACGVYSLAEGREAGLELVSGLIEGQYIEGTFITTDSIVTTYPYSQEASMTNRTELRDQLAVYSEATGLEIAGCINNYEVRITGGLEIVEVLTEVKVLSSGLSYDGQAKEIEIELTTYNPITEESAVKVIRLQYSASGNYFIDKATSEVIATSDLQVEIECEGQVVSEIKNAGEYEITLNSDANYIIFASTKATAHTFEIEVAKAGIEFNLGTIGINYSENIEVSKAFTGQAGEVFNLTFTYATSELPAGVYDLGNTEMFNWAYNNANGYAYNTGLSSTAQISNYEAVVKGSLEIAPFETSISVDFGELTYTGANQKASLDLIKPSFKAGLNLTEGIDYTRKYTYAGAETISLKNAGLYTVIFMSKNYSFTGGSYEDGYNVYEHTFEINKAGLVITLEENGKNIKRQFNNTERSFELKQDENASYVSGLVGGESVAGEFITTSAVVGTYTIGDNSLRIDSLKFFASNGVAEIESGADNYEIAYVGGIDIVYVSSNVAFELTQTSYTGSNVIFKITITTDYSLLTGGVLTETFEYNYASKTFKNASKEVSAEALSVEIGYSSEALGSYEVDEIKDAGRYVITLTSKDYTYTLGSGSVSGDNFVPAVSNAVTSQGLDLDKKAITLTLTDVGADSVVREYREELIHEQTFDNATTGTGEIFYLVFRNPDTKVLDVGRYDISNHINEGQYDYDTGKASTAQFYNYEITIAGYLDIVARAVSMTNPFEDLTYNGKDRKTEVELMASRISFGYGAQSWSGMTAGEDYWITYYAVINGESEQVSESVLIKNAGEYKVKIESSNYKLSVAGAEASHTVELSYRVNKGHLVISLTDASAENANKYIELPYIAREVTFNITEENSGDYISGLAEGEYAVISFVTSGGVVDTDYVYGGAVNSVSVNGSLEIYAGASRTDSIADGADLTNYTYEISGGIRIVANLTTVEYVGLQNLTYTNAEKAFTITLTKNIETSTNVFEAKKIVLSYANGVLSETSDEIGIDAESVFSVSVYFNKSEASFGSETTSSIRSAGFYKVVLTSASEDYIFNTSQTTAKQNTYTFEIRKHEITLDLGGLVTRDYSVQYASSPSVSPFGEQVGFNIVWEGSELFGVGQYMFASMPLSSATFTNPAQADNYTLVGFSGSLIIQRMEVEAVLYYNGAEYSETNCPTYAGQNVDYASAFSIKFFKGASEIAVTAEDFSNQFKFGSGVVSGITNAGAYTANVSSINYKFSNLTAVNAESIGGENKAVLSFEVKQKELSISLIEDGNNIKRAYNNQARSFVLDASNISEQSAYVSGAVNGEVIFATFETVGKAVGTYTNFSEAGNINKSLKVYSAGGASEIAGGLNNYAITYAGGIDIVYVVTTATYIFKDASGNEISASAMRYIGQSYEFEVEITTDNSPLGKESTSVRYIYNNNGEFVLADSSAVNANSLSLSIYYGLGKEPREVIKNAGEYVLRLESADFTYVFSADASGNSDEQSFAVGKAIKAFKLTEEITYGDEMRFEFSDSISFETYAGEEITETFKLIFTNAQTKTLNTGVYTNTTNPSVDNIYASFEANTNIVGTAVLSNYEMSIDATSTLKVNAREVKVITSEIDAMNLVYNGQARNGEVEVATSKLAFEFNSLAWELEAGVDYEVSYSASEIKDAGDYTITLTSRNYTFENAYSTSGAGGINTFKHIFDIDRAELSISLYENEDIIKQAYRNGLVTFEVSKANQGSFVNIVPETKEYIKIAFQTADLAEGRYIYGQNLSYVGSIKIYNSQDAEIDSASSIEGLKNYNVTIAGGIEIIKNIARITLINTTSGEAFSESQVYDGKEQGVRVVIDWQDVDGTNKRITANYDFATGALIDTNGETLSAETLALRVTYNGGEASEIKNVGAYTLAIESEIYTFAVVGGYSNQTSYELSITPASIEFNLGDREITYLDKFDHTNASAFIGENGEEFIVRFTYDTSEYNAGFYDISSSEDFAGGVRAENLSASTGVFSNYNIAITGWLEVKAREVTLEMESLANRTYDALDYVARLNAELASVSGEISKEGEQEIALELGSDYAIEYYKGASSTREIIDAGEYAVKLISKNFSFAGGVKGNVSGAINAITYSFVVDKRQVGITYTSVDARFESVYTTYAQNLIAGNYEFTNVMAREGVVEDLGESITYFTSAGDFVGADVRNAGGYYAVISITNPNYEIQTGAERSEVEITAYKVTQADLSRFVSDGMFSKFYGEAEPNLTSDLEILSGTGEQVKITFTRIDGTHGTQYEEVGFHRLNSNVIMHANNPQLIKANYDISAVATSFVDQSGKGAFEIKAYESKLYLTQVKNIGKTYDSQTLVSLDYSIVKEAFSVCDEAGNVLDSGKYIIKSALFGFKLDGQVQESIKDAMAYDLTLNAYETPTHKGGIELRTSGFGYVIDPKEISITVNEELSRQYDGTNAVNITSTNISFENELFADDRGRVSVAGRYVNELGVSQYDKGEHKVEFILVGAGANNYAVRNNMTEAGKITAREVYITGDARAFNKTYDTTSSITTAQVNAMVVNNVVAGENISLKGTYKKLVGGAYVAHTDVSGELIIEFSAGNSNYEVILNGGENYTGAIQAKVLKLANSKVSKAYDGTNEMDIRDLMLDESGIFSGDRNKVAIASATFAGVGVGKHLVTITLTGERAHNYTVQAIQGEIKEQIITIEFVYGDETNGHYEFVSDGKSVTRGVSAIEVQYLSSVSDLVNAVNELPMASRVGYTFLGWFTDTSFTDTFTKTTKLGTTPATMLDALKANGYKLELYAGWLRNEIAVKIEVQTEQLNLDSYEVSVLGGTYKADGIAKSEAIGEVKVKYYANLRLEAIANANYVFNGYYEAGERTSASEVIEIANIEESRMITLKFDLTRVEITLNASSLDESVAGINSINWGAMTSGVASQEMKYGKSFDLPQLTRTGYTFLGWADSEGADAVYSAELSNLGQIAEADKEYYGVWEANEYKVYLNYEGGRVEGEYTRAETDSEGVYIVVKYDSAYGELPLMIKNGFNHIGWAIKHNGLVLATGKTGSDVFNITSKVQSISASDRLELQAEYVDGFSIVGITYGLDASKYEDTGLTYTEPANAFKMEYITGKNDVSTEISSGGEILEHPTGYDLTFIGTFNTNYYAVEGWYINGTKLMDNSAVVMLGATFIASGAELRIEGIQWGADKPSIEFKYEPKEVEIEVKKYNSIYGEVVITSGVYEEAGKVRTLTGVEVQIKKEVYSGYELVASIGNSIVGASVSVIDEDKSISTITLSNYTREKVVIDIQFKAKEYAMQIVAKGAVEGIKSIEYSINNAEFGELNSSGEISIKTDDVIDLKLTVLYGFTSKDWTTSGGGLGGFSLQDVSSQVINGQAIITKRVYGFKQGVSISIEIERNEYTIAVSTAEYYNGQYIEGGASENEISAKIGGVTAEIGLYNAEVAYEAGIYKEFVAVGGSQVATPKYKFKGWYKKENGRFSEITRSVEFTENLEGSVEYFAVYELERFKIKYVVNNTEYGFVVTSAGAIVRESEVIYGEAMPFNVKARVNAGYIINDWQITYTFHDSNATKYSTLMTAGKAEITAEEIGAVKSDIEIKLILGTVMVEAVAQAKFTDGTQTAGKVQLEGLEQEGEIININAQTKEAITLGARAMKAGYEFKEWRIERADGSLADITDYNQLSETTERDANGKIIYDGITIEFIATSAEDAYKIYAIFARADNQVSASIYVEERGVEEFSGLMRGAGEVSNSGLKISAVIKTEDRVEFEMLVIAGYHYDSRAIMSYEVISAETGVVVEIREANMDSVLDIGYDKKFKVIIEGVCADTEINIYLQRDITKIYFYRMVEVSAGVWQYDETPIEGRIAFGTSAIELPDLGILTPERESYDFKGWSRGKDIVDYYLDSNGEVIGGKWEHLLEEISLYEVWEKKRVRLDVEIKPSEVLRNEDYYPEIILNNYNYWPSYSSEEGAYYYEMGSKFGLSMPSVYSQFELMEIRELKKNASGKFEWVTYEVRSGATEFDSNQLFHIDNYNNFVYTTAVNASELGEYSDGTIYIQMVYGLKLTIESANYYESGRVEVSGGEAKVDGLYTSGVYKIDSAEEPSEITVVARADSGYEISHWMIRGEAMYAGESTIRVAVTSDLSIRAVFKGKAVGVSIEASAYGEADEISGGNVEDGKYHVGDIINISARGEVGYAFNNNWNHSVRGPFTGEEYTIVASDGEIGEISLRPLFEEKTVAVRFEVEGTRGEISGVQGIEISAESGKVIYSYNIKYFTEITVEMSASERYILERVILTAGEKSSDVTWCYSEGVFTIDSSNYNNSESLVFAVDFEERYWIDYAEEIGAVEKDESGMVTVVRQLAGSGTSSDPYKISSIEDYVLWAYVINNGIQGGGYGKMPYNSAGTYYEVMSEVHFTARFWTPIGTKENEFKGQVVLYEGRIGIQVNHEIYPEELIESETFKTWGGLFGYLGEEAGIEERAKDYTMMYVIIGVAGALVIVIIILAVVIIKRKKRVEEPIDDTTLFISEE